MQYRAKDAEVMKLERDRLKNRVDELAGIEQEYMALLDKTRGFDQIKAERDMYKQKYEELLGLECECDILRSQVDKSKDASKERDALQRQVRECQCTIADQEDEIKRLVAHVDRLSDGKDDQQVILRSFRKQVWHFRAVGFGKYNSSRREQRTLCPT